MSLAPVMGDFTATSLCIHCLISHASVFFLLLPVSILYHFPNVEIVNLHQRVSVKAPSFHK